MLDDRPRYLGVLESHNNGKTASGKLVGVKWRNIHKEWYIKAWLSQWELIKSNLIKHLKEIYFNLFTVTRSTIY